ncbi:MAG: site-specific integrase [Dysgonamonadaceae bacterium]|nr:site-specific integrase [Dysgonamonadaceae bacterium]
MEQLSNYVERLYAQLCEVGRFRTAQAYRSAYQSFATYLDREATFADIYENRIKNYENYLKQRCLTLNSISFYMRNLRVVYNRAVKNKIISAQQENPFNQVYTGIAPTKKRALSEQEIRALCRKAGQLENDGLNDAVRLFLFCFYAQGMSFADAVFLKKSAVGDKTISYQRRKTGKNIIVAITAPMQKIIDSFAERTAGSDFVFPFITQGDEKSEYKQYRYALSKQNRMLKTVCSGAGLERNLSTHAARHSWASVARNHGLRLTVISTALGHSSESTTQIYLDQLDNSLLASANETVSSLFPVNIENRTA